MSQWYCHSGNVTVVLSQWYCHSGIVTVVLSQWYCKCHHIFVVRYILDDTAFCMAWDYFLPIH